MPDSVHCLGVPDGILREQRNNQRYSRVEKMNAEKAKDRSARAVVFIFNLL